MTAEEQQMIANAKKESDSFVNGFIQTLNDEFDEKEVTIASPKRLKYAYMRQLHAELEEDFSDDK